MSSAADLLVDLPSAAVDAAVVDEPGVERLAVEFKAGAPMRRRDRQQHFRPRWRAD